MYALSKAELFDREVVSKYQVYNSVFLTLPFDAIDNTGTLLPLFAESCRAGFANGLSPKAIFDGFCEKYLAGAGEQQQIDLMFRFIQYIERQVVLFDAIEDAAFPIVNSLEGKGSLREIKDNTDSDEMRAKLKQSLDEFGVRTVLTAHPTQFYPGAVLSIITDLTQAIRDGNLHEIKLLLSQLGKTPFIKKEKPSPYDEAVSLIWYLENVFYETAGEITDYIRVNLLQGRMPARPVISMGFWPGGDRDGNPFVDTKTTLMVAERLQNILLKCYHSDIRKLRRKLTFAKVDALVSNLEQKLYRSAYFDEGVSITPGDLQDRLNEIKGIVISDHQSLYLDEIESMIGKLEVFGFHFATLDIRQNSKIHNQVFAELADFDYNSLTNEAKIDWLLNSDRIINVENLPDGIAKPTLESVLAMREIQQENGERGSNRYIISNNENELHVIEALSLFAFAGWKNPTVDIVPLFEIIDDLENAAASMEKLYTNPRYAAHLRSRQNKQTVMLGFSDGTKDGGYLMANWGIYKAKEAITLVSRKYGIDVVFFDGRGGPPARGGGKTQQFYASLGPEIENREIQLTIQGQTISSNFGTPESCRFNLEHLLSAGLSNKLFEDDRQRLSESDRAILETLAEAGYKKYSDFKNHPKFVPYLERRSTLKYYAKTNIGSRPSKRGASDKLNFSDLRAIPFVGSWSQLKQNVPGTFGVGTALKYFEDSNRWSEVTDLYARSLFFRTLLENSMMSLAKSFLPLTAYMREDLEFGDFWQIIKDEFELSRRLLLKVAGHSQLMENYPAGQTSIAIREQIVLPLLTIQQYALIRIDELKDETLLPVYEKLVTRSLFGNINASRNSA